ncbi:hypothetical protein [Saccharomonospora sp. NB11]|nr:hypothetical protein [Saccharomonospora sp. NB11]
MTKRLNRRALLAGFLAMPVLVACGGNRNRGYRRRRSSNGVKVKD